MKYVLSLLCLFCLIGCQKVQPTTNPKSFSQIVEKQGYLTMVEQQESPNVYCFTQDQSSTMSLIRLDDVQQAVDYLTKTKEYYQNEGFVIQDGENKEVGFIYSRMESDDGSSLIIQYKQYVIDVLYHDQDKEKVQSALKDLGYPIVFEQE